VGDPSRAEKGTPTEGHPYSFVNYQVLDLSSNWAAEREEAPVSGVGDPETGALGAPGEVSHHPGTVTDASEGGAASDLETRLQNQFQSVHGHYPADTGQQFFHFEGLIEKIIGA
jgi:hypothetical protein